MRLTQPHRKQAKLSQTSPAAALTTSLPTEPVFLWLHTSSASKRCERFRSDCITLAVIWHNAKTITRANDPAALEAELLAGCKSNVVGNIFLFSLFIPLILRGKQKKVIAISSAMGDIDFIAKNNIEASGPYAVGKAATNTVVAKFSAKYAKDGVLFMSICPGVVDTGHFDPAKRTSPCLWLPPLPAGPWGSCTRLI